MKGSGRVVAAFDVGGHNIRCLVAGLDGEILASGSKATLRQAETAEANVQQLTSLLAELLESVALGPQDLERISIGVPGAVNPETGVILLVPNIPAWDNFNLRVCLEERLDVPVQIDNDVNLAAQGEFWKGAAVGAATFFFMGLGTGIGGGIFINGKLFRGSRYSAGEVGYLALEPRSAGKRLGDLGFFESVASGLALDMAGSEAAQDAPESRLGQLLRERSRVSSREVFEASDEGDQGAREILDSVFEYIALAVVNVAALLDPDLIVFGGGMASQGDRLLNPVRERAEVYGLPLPRLELSQLGEQAQLYGALYAAIC